MLENNTARLIFFMSGVIVMGLVIPIIVSHWDEIKTLIDVFYQNRTNKM